MLNSQRMQNIGLLENSKNTKSSKKDWKWFTTHLFSYWINLSQMNLFLLRSRYFKANICVNSCIIRRFGDGKSMQTFYIKAFQSIQLGTYRLRLINVFENRIVHSPNAAFDRFCANSLKLPTLWLLGTCELLSNGYPHARLSGYFWFLNPQNEYASLHGVVLWIEKEKREESRFIECFWIKSEI